jgi:predicted metal-dependent HD superfamily phosphohydrolase
MAYENVRSVEGLLKTIFDLGLNHMAGVDLAYHNLEHVSTMLNSFRILAKENAVFERVYADRRLNLQMHVAIAWHDAICEIGAPKGQNERNSVDLLKSRIPTQAYERFPELSDWMSDIEALIMATAEHFTDYTPKNEAESVIMDLDVLNFSWDTDAFLMASSQVDQEACERYGIDRARAGRLAFFETIKDFRFHVLNEELQNQANLNITLMIEKLRAEVAQNHIKGTKND